MKSKVEPLLPIELGKGRIPYARGISAGEWVFATSILATDFQNGLTPEVATSRLRSGKPRWNREAACLYSRAAEVLKAAGADFSHVVRTDQFLRTGSPAASMELHPKRKCLRVTYVKGNRIQPDAADYIIRKKFIPALKDAGSSLENVVKAQVYLSDISDSRASILT